MAGEDQAADQADPAPKYPRVEDAFFLVLPSYDWMLRRFDAIDMRLRHIATVAATMTLAVPVAATAVGAQVLDSCWLVAAMGVGLATMLLSTILQTSSGLTLMDPAQVRQYDLGKTRWLFHNDLLADTAKHRETNQKIVNRRGKYAYWLGFLLIVEVALFSWGLLQKAV